jgi:hypothetical protein
VDLKAMVNGLIKINEDYEVDFSFVDKVLLNMVGIKKNDLLKALRINESPRYFD